MRRALAALGLAPLLVGCGAAARAPRAPARTPDPPAGRPACVAPAAGDHDVTVERGRVPVLVHIPPGRAARRRPLVLVLPGADMTGRDMADYTGYSRLADRRGFVVAYPTATGSRPFWNISTRDGAADDVAYLRHVITDLTGAGACADPERVGVTGVSNGGGMSALMACRAADLLAAAAPVAGGYSTLPECHPELPIPLLEIHGLRDRVVPYEGKPPDYLGDVREFLAGWRHRDGCHRRAVVTHPARRVLELRWNCDGGRAVVHDRIADAEHGWPGEDSLRPFSSTLRTWRFISAFHR